MTTGQTVKSILLVMLAACGPATTNPSLCDQASVTPNPVCNQACNATPGAGDSCPTGYHCAPDGQCDAQCDAANACNSGFTCDLSTGTCILDGNGSGSGGPDANCPAVNFTAMPTTPSVHLLIDRSGSMNDPSGNVTRYEAVQAALTGATGVVTQLEQQVYFGASLYFDGGATCPQLTTVGRAKGNRSAINGLFQSAPNGSTPTPPSITAAVADFVANPPPAGSPPILVLATDGDPNICGGNTSTKAESVAAAMASYSTAIGANTNLPLYVLAVGNDLDPAHLSDLAHAGQGAAVGANCTPGSAGCYYLGNNQAELAAAFQTIIGGVLSCNLALSGQVDPNNASGGTVTLNGTNLTYGTDWTVAADGVTLQILGAACDTLKASATPNVAASFPCGSVIF